jgi:8-oxo-dGTP pyrophosphatase MutT (NUDIX family)
MPEKVKFRIDGLADDVGHPADLGPVAMGAAARVTLQRKRKGDAPADAAMQYTVIVAVRGGDGSKEFLMVDHRQRGWELPGGKIEPNEGPVHCALREFREETGHLLGSPRFVVKLHKANGTCYVFTGGLGPKVESATQDKAVGEMRWFSRLPRDEKLAFPDDPYDEMGKLLGIDFG